jgi:hypothetical protein
VSEPDPEIEFGPFSSPGATPTSWAETEGALRRVQKYLLCTVRPDGRPHVTPLLAIWSAGAMWFTTGATEQKAINLDSNPRCALIAGTGSLTATDYVIEGVARLVVDDQERADAATAFEEAYGWQITREDGTWHGLAENVRSGDVRLYRVKPVHGFAFVPGAESSQTGYRWGR